MQNTKHTGFIENALTPEIEQELKKAVSVIEGGVPTTKGHYGVYMSILSRAKDKRSREILAEVLLKVGANKQGVEDALREVTK